MIGVGQMEGMSRRDAPQNCENRPGVAQVCCPPRIHSHSADYNRYQNILYGTVSAFLVL